MNKKQYNNVINHTLKYEQVTSEEDNLASARAIFKNLGVALPQGDMKTVCETIKTDNYMGWKPCTMEEAQAAADEGIAAIGINDNKIVVLAANDEEAPITENESVIAVTENTSALSMSGLQFYSYSYGGTGCSTCPSIRYNRAAAVDYAREYAYSTGPGYVDFGDLIFAVKYYVRYGVSTGLADCANFVSQCLVAGGFKMNSDWFFYEHNNTPVTSSGNTQYRDMDGELVPYSTSYYFSAPWTTAGGQYKYFSNIANGYTSTSVVKINSVKGIAYAVSHYDIKPGDLMYFSEDGGKTVHHATIISAVTSNDIKFCAHTIGRCDKKLSEALGDETVIIVRLNDSIYK